MIKNMTNQAKAKKNLEIRDVRKKEQFVVDDAYLNGWARHCGPYATCVYVALCRHANSSTQSCFPSIETIATKLGISTRQVNRALNILENMNIISRQREKYRNIYYLLDRGVWIKADATNSRLSDAHRSARQSFDSASNSRNKDSHIKCYHHPLPLAANEEEDREKIIRRLKQWYSTAKWPNDMPTKLLDYFLWLLGEGRIQDIRHPVRYLRKLTIEYDFPPICEREAQDQYRSTATMSEKLTKEREPMPKETKEFIEAL